MVAVVVVPGSRVCSGAQAAAEAAEAETQAEEMVQSGTRVWGLRYLN